jgi:hypothetical protein
VTVGWAEWAPGIGSEGFGAAGGRVVVAWRLRNSRRTWAGVDGDPVRLPWAATVLDDRARPVVVAYGQSGSARPSGLQADHSALDQRQFALVIKPGPRWSSAGAVPGVRGGTLPWAWVWQNSRSGCMRCPGAASATRQPPARCARLRHEVRQAGSGKGPFSQPGHGPGAHGTTIYFRQWGSPLAAWGPSRPSRPSRPSKSSSHRHRHNHRPGPTAPAPLPRPHCPAAPHRRSATRQRVPDFSCLCN